MSAGRGSVEVYFPTASKGGEPPDEEPDVPDEQQVSRKFVCEGPVREGVMGGSLGEPSGPPISPCRSPFAGVSRVVAESFDESIFSMTNCSRLGDEEVVQPSGRGGAERGASHALVDLAAREAIWGVLVDARAWC
eukprot:2551188-Heterocapsa_arctica.AAC.1